MKKILLSSVLALAAMGASAGTMTFTTDLPAGTSVRILLNTTSATNPVSIDWGNGVAVNYTVDPNQMAYNRWIEASIEGPTIKITGNITEATIQELGLTSAKLENMSQLKDIDFSNNSITDFEIVGTTPLKNVNLSYNTIHNSVYYNTTLSLENAAETLTNLNVSHNPGLICLDIRYLTNLEYLSAYDCPDLGSVFICMPEESRPNLRQVSLQNCDLSHFYPVSLPGLRTLSLGNNKLMTGYSDDPFVLGDYPELTTLDISNNPGITSLDITGCKKLESLSISNDRFTILDVSQAPNLTSLVATNNNISTFDLGNNLELKTINIAGNPVRELDLSIFPNLTSVNISDTQISRVMLMKAYYLTDFTARNTNIEFIDFNGQQANRMRTIDIRDNKRMTGETMTYTLRTLPEAYGTSYASGNLYIDGSNYEHAYTEIATDLDHHWNIDVHGDGTALNTLIDVTVDATDTGRNVTGRLDRLYPNFGMGMDYDFDVYSTDGGEFLISQWKPVWFQSMQSVTDEAYKGVPIHIYPYPEEGKKFKSVTVNGEEIASQWFVVSEPNSVIKVNFTSEENSLSFTTTPGQSLSFLVNTTDYNGTIWVDWGTGTRTEYKGQTRYTSGTTQIGGSRIDGSAAGSTVTLYGDIAALDLSGFGDMAEWFGLWDNAVTAIELGNADNLKYLSLYWNPVKNLDLSGAPNLEILNVSYTDLKTLDLSNTPGLLWLEAYSDGWGEDGISMLSEINLSNLPLLQYLDVKNNELSALDLSKNTRLRWLCANNNEISAIDLSKNTALENLEISGNKLTALDVTQLTALVDLTAGNNQLTTLDVSNNRELATLDISNNYIKTIDTSALYGLRKLYINGNGMSADNLNDTYYKLPQRQHGADDEGQMASGWNLAVIQGLDREENDGNRADSSIAIDRGWTPSHQGSNGGSDTAYLDIISSPYGSLLVKDAQGTEYGHGSKVPKYTDLTIVATPVEGYKFVSFTLNDDEAQTGTTFTMPGIYTKLRPTFAKGAGVDSASSGVAIIGGNGMITIQAEAGVADIFTANGQHIVAAMAVDGSASVSLQAGVYVVRVATAEGIQTAKVIVK